MDVALLAYFQRAQLRGPFSSVSPGGYSIGVLPSGLQKACRQGRTVLLFKCIVEMLAFAFVENGRALVTNLRNRLHIILVEDCAASWADTMDLVRLVDELVVEPGVRKAWVIAERMCALPKGRVASRIRAAYGHG